jgi:hypothetical protein
MTKTNHEELAKHLPADFFTRKISGQEFVHLLEEVKNADDPAHRLLEFLVRHGFEVEK